MIEQTRIDLCNQEKRKDEERKGEPGEQSRGGRIGATWVPGEMNRRGEKMRTWGIEQKRGCSA